MFDFAYSYNTLDIPAVVGPYVTATSGIAGALLVPLVVMEMINEHTRALLSKDDKTPHVTRIFAVTFIVLLSSVFLYRFLFMKIVAVCEAIGFAMFRGADWGNFVDSLVKSEQGQVSMLQLNVSAFAAAFFSVVLKIIDGLFMMVRFVVLSVLYVIGPLAIVGGVSSITRPYMRGWFKMVFMVSFWVVLFRALQGVLLALNASAGTAQDSLAAPVINGLIITMFSLAIPHFTEALFSAGFIGAVGAGFVQSTVRYSQAAVAKHLPVAASGAISKLGQWFDGAKAYPRPSRQASTPSGAGGETARAAAPSPRLR